jgi:hypothetical protein
MENCGLLYSTKYEFPDYFNFKKLLSDFTLGKVWYFDFKFRDTSDFTGVFFMFFILIIYSDQVKNRRRP